MGDSVEVELLQAVAGVIDSLMGGVKGSTVSICHIRDGVVKFCEYDDPIVRYQ